MDYLQIYCWEYICQLFNKYMCIKSPVYLDTHTYCIHIYIYYMHYTYKFTTWLCEYSRRVIPIIVTSVVGWPELAASLLHFLSEFIYFAANRQSLIKDRVAEWSQRREESRIFPCSLPISTDKMARCKQRVGRWICSFKWAVRDFYTFQVLLP